MIWWPLQELNVGKAACSEKRRIARDRSGGAGKNRKKDAFVDFPAAHREEISVVAVLFFPPIQRSELRAQAP